jgi:hypothetical protein
MMFLAHEANWKQSKNSYFKNWILNMRWSQSKELKSANTQLIANDALGIFFFINKMIIIVNIDVNRVKTIC